MSPTKDRLARLGWDACWMAEAVRAGFSGQPGRVTQASRLLVVTDALGEVLVEGPRALDQVPVCGDWVMIERLQQSGGEDARAVLRGVLSRRNAIIRQTVGSPRPQALAANLDRVFLVLGLDRSQGIRSLPRYQALARLNNVVVTVLLNKADLCEDLEHALAWAGSLAPDLELIPLVASQNGGICPLYPSLAAGTTVALLGPSGAGKSTLINALVGGEAVRTGAVRAGDRRGRHTTSAARLLTTDGGVSIIDTPGLRELGLWGDAGLRNTYNDIALLGHSCRFRDCTHDHEPGCAVRQALAEGELSSERFLSYLELEREQATRARLIRGKKRRYR